MSRKLGLIIPLLLASVLIAGCSGGSYSIMNGSVHASGSSISGSYRSFSGDYYKQVQFERGQTVRFTYTNHTISGRLTAKVLDPEGWTMVELTGQDSVVIPKAGKYKVIVNGKKHEGDFMVYWE